MPDGSDLPRPARQYGPQDWLLAGGAGCAILRVQGCRRPDHPRFTQGWPPAARSQEPRPQLSDRHHPSPREGRRCRSSARQDVAPRWRKTGRLRYRLLSRRPWSDVGPRGRQEFDQADRILPRRGQASLDRNFCPDCGARLFTTNLDSFPGTIFVTLGSLDRPELVEPMLEMFTKRRLKWERPLDVPQFSSMPG